VEPAFVDWSEGLFSFSGGSLSECGERIVFLLGVKSDIFSEGQEDWQSSLEVGLYNRTFANS
jgi:hypothetical protein